MMMGWILWILLVTAYVVCYYFAFIVIARWRIRATIKELGRVPSWKRDEALQAALAGALIWPVLLPGILAWHFATKVPVPEPVKPEAKKDWVEGYDDNTMMDVDY